LPSSDRSDAVIRKPENLPLTFIPQSYPITPQTIKTGFGAEAGFFMQDLESGEYYL